MSVEPQIVSERSDSKVVSGFSRRDVASTGSVALHEPRLSAKRASHLRTVWSSGFSRPPVRARRGRNRPKSLTTFAQLEIEIAPLETPSKKLETGAHCLETSSRKLEMDSDCMETRIKHLEMSTHWLETRIGLLETHSRCLEMTTPQPEIAPSHPETPIQQRKAILFKPEIQPTNNQK